MAAAASCGICAICLADLEPAEEAFLDACFHHFHLQCIQRWAAAQREQAEGDRRAQLACPLCRRPFASAIYDCHDTAFRREYFPPEGATTRGAGGSGRSTPTAAEGSGSLHLTAAHRRRRAVYSTLLPEEQRQRLGRQQLGRAQASRADIGEFVTRELQALMLQADVALVAKHVVGTLQNAAPTAAGGSNGARAAGVAPKRMLLVPHQQHGVLLRPGAMALPKNGAAACGGSRQTSSSGSGGVALPAVAAKVQAAAAPFLFEQAERFAWEVAAFVAASGSSVAAYDRLVLQQDAAAAGSAGAEARRQLRLRQLQQRQEQASGEGKGGVWPQAGSGSSNSDSDDSLRRQQQQRSPEAQRSDSEGYLELLLHQGRSRQRQTGNQQQQQQQQEGDSQPNSLGQAAPTHTAPAARGAAEAEATSRRSRSRSWSSRRRVSERHRSSPRKHKQRRRRRHSGSRSRSRSRSCSRGGGKEPVAAGDTSAAELADDTSVAKLAGDTSAAEQMAALRQQAREAFERHKQQQQQQQQQQ